MDSFLEGYNTQNWTCAAAKGNSSLSLSETNTHFCKGRYLSDQTQTHGSLARRIHRCRITNGFVTRTRSMTLTLSGMQQQCSSTNGSQWYKRPCCPA